MLSSSNKATVLIGLWYDAAGGGHSKRSLTIFTLNIELNIEYSFSKDTDAPNL